MKKDNVLKFEKKPKKIDIPMYVNENSPEKYTIRGPAICMNCKHEWEVVSSLGQYAFPCPKCKTEKGVMKYFIEVRGRGHFICSECSFPFFYLLGDGVAQCPICGMCIYPGDQTL